MLADNNAVLSVLHRCSALAAAGRCDPLQGLAEPPQKQQVVMHRSQPAPLARAPSDDAVGPDKNGYIWLTWLTEYTAADAACGEAVRQILADPDYQQICKPGRQATGKEQLRRVRALLCEKLPQVFRDDHYRERFACIYNGMDDRKLEVYNTPPFDLPAARYHRAMFLLAPTGVKVVCRAYPQTWLAAWREWHKATGEVAKYKYHVALYGSLAAGAPPEYNIFEEEIRCGSAPS